ncbi:MAG TPA: Gfo/Idh/MocA family oxidoreductase [Tepidisphaeraceae bacterium]|nr:Gfo/Idh/MocA family oxidoreductase [Tepidisphaeraceae bacterium]
MSKPLSLALVGLGGYGNGYVSALLDHWDRGDVRLIAGVDPMPTTCARLAEVQARQVPIYPSLDAFFKDATADLVLICSPIQYHASQTCLALNHGVNVLCEKPLCATLDDAGEMLSARDRAGKLVAIGYQWSYSKAIGELKADILAGKLARPRRLKCIALWPRDESYYTRNGWAGAKQDAQGRWVLDSPVNNACAHQLHNMLYVLGPQTDRSAKPARLTAELYRANNIGNYDTAAIRCFTSDGVELMFITSHATAHSHGPVFEYEFDNATMRFHDGPAAPIVAKFKNGGERNYGTPMEPRDHKLSLTLTHVREGMPTPCGIEAAVSHTQCVWAAQQSVAEITPFPRERVRVTGEPGHRKTTVEGLSETLTRCYDEWKLPSEIGAGWGQPGREVHIDGMLINK